MYVQKTAILMVNSHKHHKIKLVLSETTVTTTAVSIMMINLDQYIKYVLGNNCRQLSHLMALLQIILYVAGTGSTNTSLTQTQRIQLNEYILHIAEQANITL